MDLSPDITENILSRINFSRGHEKTVWNKILSRVKAYDEALSLSELDDVAGGLSEPPDTDENARIPKKK